MSSVCGCEDCEKWREGARKQLNEIIKIMNLALHEPEASSSCETYCGTAIDMLKEFRDEEL